MHSTHELSQARHIFVELSPKYPDKQLVLQYVGPGGDNKNKPLLQAIQAVGPLLVQLRHVLSQV